MFRVNNLRKIYHSLGGEVLAVDNFSLDLNKGEFISIIGPSGCGKSTILSILSGIDKDYKGDISSNIKTGYMLQRDNLFDWLSVLDNCLLGIKLDHKVNNEDKKYVMGLLKKYGLGDFIDKYPKNLSGGMRQRVSLIRTLAVKPDLLLLDEPFSALDVMNRLMVSNDVYNIIKNEKKSVIMVTHDINEAISMSDRIILLSERPSRIKKVYKINLLGSPIERRKNKSFNDLFNRIWSDFR